ncbi:reticuline oxidase-like protein-like protein [Corchorus olitorius]|uniref:Reticuline oxidase-like protein-like protein n=1 Tax=Corchorus olitorius TaxID=93759 RepID=A0A1R3HLN8_9ROSI|nr:reticuline oxidase-like protein-like protein [Corchorus olitorius]
MDAKTPRFDPYLPANPNLTPFLQSRSYNPMNLNPTEPKFHHFDLHPPPSDPLDLKICYSPSLQLQTPPCSKRKGVESRKRSKGIRDRKGGFF